MQNMNETLSLFHFWLVINAYFALTQSLVLNLIHFRKRLFKCDIGLVHLTYRSFQFQLSIDYLQNNYSYLLIALIFNNMNVS